MRTKLLSSIVLGTMALAGVASADPIVRDHRYEPAVVYPTSSYQTTVQHRPSWMPYGFQVSAAWNGNVGVTPYSYGQDPYVEGIARNQWMVLGRRLQLGYQRDTQAAIDMNGRSLRSIELQATGGRNYIEEVHVELVDGREIKLSTKRLMDGSAPNMRLDLGGQANCGIARIEIFGHSSPDGRFRVIGG